MPFISPVCTTISGRCRRCAGRQAVVRDHAGLPCGIRRPSLRPAPRRRARGRQARERTGAPAQRDRAQLVASRREPSRTGPVSQSTTTDGDPAAASSQRCAAVGDRIGPGRCARPSVTTTSNGRRAGSRSRSTRARARAAAARRRGECGRRSAARQAAPSRVSTVDVGGSSSVGLPAPPEGHQPDLVAPLVGVEQQRQDRGLDRPIRCAGGHRSAGVDQKSTRLPRGPRARAWRRSSRAQHAARCDRRGRARADAARRRSSVALVCSRVSRSAAGPGARPCGRCRHASAPAAPRPQARPTPTVGTPQQLRAIGRRRGRPPARSAGGCCCRPPRRLPAVPPARSRSSRSGPPPCRVVVRRSGRVFGPASCDRLLERLLVDPGRAGRVERVVGRRRCRCGSASRAAARTSSAVTSVRPVPGGERDRGARR